MLRGQHLIPLLLPRRLISPLIRIIEPLASRCSKFRFTPLDVTATRTRLEHIALSERIDVSPEVILALIQTSEGDLRRSITYLQSASRLSVSTTPHIPIRPIDIQEIAGVVPDEIVKGFLEVLGVEMPRTADDMDVDVNVSRKVAGFDGVQRKVKEIVREGYSTTQLLSQVSRLMFSHRGLTHYSLALLPFSCMTPLFPTPFSRLCRNHAVL